MIDLGQAVFAMAAFTAALLALVSYQALRDDARINVAFAPSQIASEEQYSCEC